MAKLDGFLDYKTKHLPKVNSLRLANSLVNISSVPILERGQVLFSPAASSHNEPRSCYNCPFYNSRAKTCRFFGPDIRIEKFVYPVTPEKESKPIEYWPVCGAWDYGTPTEGTAVYKERPLDSPDDLGLGWVNAPEIGLDHSGTCCGGQNGGDDCDNYMIKGDKKREADEGFCRVLQDGVENMDCCAAWTDDDYVDWRKGQKLLEDLDKERNGPYNPNPFTKR